jgi:hypothetical protein
VVKFKINNTGEYTELLWLPETINNLWFSRW